MRNRFGSFLIAFSSIVAAGCGSSDTPATTPTPDGGMVSDVPVVPGTTAGTCAAPVRLDMAATRNGTTWVYEGTTVGGANTLHPYGEDPPTDAAESVLEFRIPAGMTNVKITTEGSSFDTILYVREACSQVAGGVDTSFGDDTALADPTMDGNYATIFLTGLQQGQVRFLVVDGRAMGTPPNGRFRLTIAPFEPGTMGNPCAESAMGDPTCSSGALRCSPANRCTTMVAVGAQCDGRGINNACAMGSACVGDPTPPMGMEAALTCAAPGTRPGAACREGVGPTRCDLPLICNDAMENPVCVRRLGSEQACDPMGLANRCMEGMRCRTLGMDGMSFCEVGA